MWSGMAAQTNQVVGTVVAGFKPARIIAAPVVARIIAAPVVARIIAAPVVARIIAAFAIGSFVCQASPHLDTAIMQLVQSSQGAE